MQIKMPRLMEAHPGEGLVQSAQTLLPARLEMTSIERHLSDRFILQKSPPMVDGMPYLMERQFKLR